MKRSDVLLWILALVFAGALIWLASTGQLQGIVNSLVDGFWNFYANIARTLRR